MYGYERSGYDKSGYESCAFHERCVCVDKRGVCDERCVDMGGVWIWEVCVDMRGVWI